MIHPTALLVFQELTASKTDQSTALKSTPFFQKMAMVCHCSRRFDGDPGGDARVCSQPGAGYDVEHARAMALAALTIASAGITAVLSRLRSRMAWCIVMITH